MSAQLALALEENTIPNCTFELTFDYSEHLETLIQQYARLNFALPYLPRVVIDLARFGDPRAPEVRLTAKLFEFQSGVSLKEAARRMRFAHWEPADIEHVLAFGLKYPFGAQTWPHTVGLGKTQTVLTVGATLQSGAFRAFTELRPAWHDYSGGNTRFLAVRSK